jgi:hypothetical protein
MPQIRVGLIGDSPALGCAARDSDTMACRAPGQLSIRPTDGAESIVGQQYADLSCGHCVPPWEICDVRLDQPPWSAGVGFKCPGCRRPVMMASRIIGEGPTPSMSHLF